MTMTAQNMPSTNRWVGKGQNPTCGKGRQWDITLTAPVSQGDVARGGRSPAPAGGSWGKQHEWQQEKRKDLV